MTRREFLTFPARSLLPIATRHKAAVQMSSLTAQLEQLQPWPERADDKPETMTLEQLTLKVRVHTGVDEILAKMIGIHTRQIHWLLRMVAGPEVPAAKGEI